MRQLTGTSAFVLALAVISQSATAETTGLRPTLAGNAKATSPSRRPDPGVRTPAPAAAPDRWSLNEIRAAQKLCKKLLKRAGAIATPVAPIKTGRCGDPAPVRLIQLGKIPVTFDPPPRVNCRMVAALAKWIDTGLQPLAKKHIGARLTKISVMSSYSCRNRYGRKTGRLSEHATANALDIGGFVFGDGLKARLLAHWGPTRRDAVAGNAAASRSTEPRTTGSAAPPASPQARLPRPVAAAFRPTEAFGVIRVRRADPEFPTAASGLGRPELPPPLPHRRPSLKERMQWVQQERLAARRKAEAQRKRIEKYRARLNRFLYARDHLGGPKSPDAGVPRLTAGHPRPDRKAFLKAAWASACKTFGTVLGPEANDAHRNHFHVDLAPRRRRNYCR